MERCISMSHRLALLALVILTSILTSSARAERSVVLVTHEGCAMETISMLDIRKAYFGIAVSYQGRLVRAFRLNSDVDLNRVFFQTVVAMSEKSYERRLLSMLLKYGTRRPPEFEDVAALAEALRRSDCGIAYLWLDDVTSEKSLKSIRLLWQGD